jgi:2-phosphosulfolactate phosphatase
MKLSVFHCPEAVPQADLPDCAVAVDVLRATTTIATALKAGAEAVQVFSSLDHLNQASEAWSPSLRLRIGERGGRMVDGFDLGNSPLECTPEVVMGKRIFMSTTNGTRALECIRAAGTVLTGAFINRKSIVDYLLAKQPETVWIVGSGWEGSYSLEDTGCAGAIAAGVLAQAPSVTLENDEAFAAIALYEAYRQRLLALAEAASHGQRLLKLNLRKDLQYCTEVDRLNIVPIQREPGVLVAMQ